MMPVWVVCSLGMFFCPIPCFLCGSCKVRGLSVLWLVFWALLVVVLSSSDEIWGCPALQRDSFKSESSWSNILYFSVRKQVHKNLVWMSESNNCAAVLRVSCLSAIVTMSIKSLVPIEKGSAVFYSQIVFPLESIYFIGSFKINFSLFLEISLRSAMCFKCTYPTVSSVVLVCTCACAWTVWFFCISEIGRSLWWELRNTFCRRNTVT